jgi:anti-sigma factor RsiW
VTGQGGHLDELLTAHLDGELDDAERAEVETHLASCADCRRELEALRHVRSVLRGAPAVDPPFGFFERMTSRRRRPRWIAAASVAGIAAAWIVVVGFVLAPARTTVEPPVESARAALGSGDGVRVTMLSGKVAWSTLTGGLRRPIDGVDGTPWESTDPFKPVAVVFEVDDTGVLVVGRDQREVETAASQISKSHERSILDHLRDAVASLVSWVY